MPDSTTQRFNDDLLLADRDQELVRRSFPRLAPVLIFPDLIVMFDEFERDANSAKRSCHFLGKAAVYLGTIALFGAASAPVIEKLLVPWPEYIGLSVAFLGIVSVLIGSFGLFFAKSKHRWLCARLMTERLRQFQLQALAFQLPSILAAMQGGEFLDRYCDLRGRWFARFELNYRTHLPGKLEQILNDNTDDHFVLHNKEDDAFTTQADSALTEVFDAYRLLRFEHQIGYASFKLGTDNFRQPQRQRSLLTALSWLSIVIVFVIHLLVALSLKPGWLSSLNSPWIHVVVLWAAIAALAARAFEEGLQPAREVTRYSSYKSAMVALERSFDEAVTPAEKLQLMRMTERLMYQEMRGFLQTNNEARFVL